MGRVVRFPPPAASGPEPVSPGHPVRHVPSVAGAVGAFFAGCDLAAETRRTYRQALDPLVEAVDDDNRPVTDLDPDLVAAVFARAGSSIYAQCERSAEAPNSRSRTSHDLRPPEAESTKERCPGPDAERWRGSEWPPHVQLTRISPIPPGVLLASVF